MPADYSSETPGLARATRDVGTKAGQGYVDECRSVLGQADASLYLLGMSRDDLERLALSNPLGETHGNLRNAQLAAKQLRSLAVDFARVADTLREVVSDVNERADRERADLQESERPEYVRPWEQRDGEPVRG